MLSLVVFVLLLSYCRADYDCLCSYDVEKPVYDAASSQSIVIGYLYEFDCKPFNKVGGVDTKTWGPIAFEHQQGYVTMDQSTTLQVCPGDPSTIDTLTTMAAPITSTRSQTTVSTTVSSTITPPTNATTETTSPTATVSYSNATVSSSSVSTPAPAVSFSTSIPIATQPTAVNSSTSSHIATQPTEVNSSTSSPIATQPTAVNSSTSSPLATQPTAVNSSTSSPLATQPTVVNSSTSSPIATQRTAVNSSTSSSLATQPTAVNSSTSSPLATQPTAVNSSTSSPLATQPTAVNSSTSSPLATQPTAVNSSTSSPLATQQMTTNSSKMTTTSPQMRTTLPQTVQTTDASQTVTNSSQMMTTSNESITTPNQINQTTITLIQTNGTRITTTQMTTTATLTTKNSPITAKTTITPAQANQTTFTSQTTTAPIQTTTTPTQTTTTQSQTMTTLTQMMTTPTQMMTTPTQTTTTQTTTSPTQTTTTATIPTTQSSTTSHTTARSTQSASTTPSKVVSPIFGDVSLCPISVQQYPQTDGDILAQKGDNCYMVVPHKVSWSHAENICTARGGHLFHVSSSAENEFIYNLLHSQFEHAVWMGLNDKAQEEHFTWTSGSPVNYTNWTPGRKSNHENNNLEDCTVFVPYLNRGQWDDINCGSTSSSTITEGYYETHYFICQFGIDTTGSGQVISGHTELCPSNLKFAVISENGILEQYGQSCYEWVPSSVSWFQAESSCNKNGGHLVQIADAKEEEFITKFMNIHDSLHAVWIGLHDTDHEEKFTWTSGDPVTYTNWITGRKSNYASNTVEDCVAFLPYNQGKWDDIPCGMPAGLGGNSEAHFYICEYKIQSGSSGGFPVIGK